MAKIERFEDLICWQKARIIVNNIYDITTTGEFSKDWSLKDQIRRAAISVMLYIPEGFCRKSHKEFKQFLFFAHGSIGEIQSALYIAIDRKYINQDIFNEIYAKCEEDSKIISGLIKSLELNYMILTQCTQCTQHTQCILHIQYTQSTLC